HLRWRHPDASVGPHSQSRIALYAVSLERTLLTDASSADYRPQPSLDGVRRDLGVVHGLPGLRFRHEPGEGQHRHDPPGQWLRHLMVRQEPQYAGVPAQHGRALRSMAFGDGLRVFLRVHGRRDRSVDALPLPRSYSDLSMG